MMIRPALAPLQVCPAAEDGGAGGFFKNYKRAC
jgi:hypothetical protein